MIDAFVQKLPIVRYEHEALLFPKICGNRLFRLVIQMIGRFVKQKKTAFAQKHRRKQGLCPFAARQGIEGTVKRLVGELQKRQFAQYAPFFRAADLLCHTEDIFFPVPYGAREILYARGAGNRPLIFALEFPLQ